MHVPLYDWSVILLYFLHAPKPVWVSVSDITKYTNLRAIFDTFNIWESKDHDLPLTAVFAKLHLKGILTLGPNLTKFEKDSTINYIPSIKRFDGPVF